MRRLISGLLAVALLLCLTACDKGGLWEGADQPAAAPAYPPKIGFGDNDAELEVRENNPVSEETIIAVNRFSYDTAAQLLTEIETNGCFSPLSLYFALSLAAAGAEGETLEEFLEVLGTQNKSGLSEQCGNLYRRLYTDNEYSKLLVANSLWLDEKLSGQEIAFKQGFLDSAAKDFYASVYSVDFAGEGAGKAMSRWISENTNGTLSPKFEADAEQIMSILNTVYFYAQWLDRFDQRDTKSDAFYLASGGNVECDFMNMTYGSHGFSRGDGYTKASLALKSSGSMVFILPDEGVSVSQLLASPEKIEEIFTRDDDKFGEVIWSVPKFGCGSGFDLTDTLKTLGITSAFGRDADFSAVTDSRAFLSGVKQETHISIDENGVEASAFTKIDYYGAALPQDKAEMILNRPFIYGITAFGGTLLFIGLCGDPTV